MKYSPNLRKMISLCYGIFCHTAFIFGVGMMIICMYSGMQLAKGHLKIPWSLVVNIFLIIQFPLFHSFFLTKKGRLWLRKLAPSELSVDLISTTFVIVASLQVLMLFFLWTPSGIIWWQAKGYLLTAMTVIYAGAWLLVFKSMSDASFSFQTGLLGWWAIWKGEKPIYPKMPTTGMFRLCRQPIYLSFTLTLWTVPVWTPDQLIIAFFFTIYCILGPLLKENRFSKIYDQEFKEYQRNIPYWFPFSKNKFKMNQTILNNQSLYWSDAEDWWNGKYCWLRTMHNLVKPRMEIFDGYIKSWGGKTVLDIGCGGGFMSEELARRGAQVTGIDPSLPAIEAAKKHALLSHLKINYQVGIAEHLPIPDVSFDYVIIVDVLEHISNIEYVIKEINRILKPGGLMLFDTINRTLLAYFIYILLGEKILKISPKGTHDPKKFIKPEELKILLKKYQLKLGPIKGIGPIGFNYHFDILFGRWPISAPIYIGYAIKPHK